jgi:hypothetical protein
MRREIAPLPRAFGFGTRQSILGNPGAIFLSLGNLRGREYFLDQDGADENSRVVGSGVQADLFDFFGGPLLGRTVPLRGAGFGSRELGFGDLGLAGFGIYMPVDLEPRT